MRSLEEVISQIVEMTPDTFKNKEVLIKRLKNVVEDAQYRGNEFIAISWMDVRLILLNIFSTELKDNEWTWVDDIFELFSEGKWGKKYGNKKLVTVGV